MWPMRLAFALLLGAFVGLAVQHLKVVLAVAAGEVATET